MGGFAQKKLQLEERKPLVSAKDVHSYLGISMPKLMLVYATVVLIKLASWRSSMLMTFYLLQRTTRL